jgi:hypothetical protein
MTKRSDQIEKLLMAERPAPRAAFRGVLRRHLRAIGTPPSRPRNLTRLVLGFASGGVLLLLVGVLSIAGLGPLGS